MQMNLKTILSAYPQLSDSILKDYAKRDEVAQVVDSIRAEVAETYVPEVEDRDSDKIYARSGKDRQWVELKTSTEASDIDIYYGYNLDEQMDIYREDADKLELTNDVTNLQYHSNVAKNSKYWDMDCIIPENEEGYMWICSTQPIKSIQWMGYSWGNYSQQRDVAVDPDTKREYFCYRSNDVLTDNVWSFRLIF